MTKFFLKENLQFFFSKSSQICFWTLSKWKSNVTLMFKHFTAKKSCGLTNLCATNLQMVENAFLMNVAEDKMRHLAEFFYWIWRCPIALMEIIFRISCWMEFFIFWYYKFKCLLGSKPTVNKRLFSCW